MEYAKISLTLSMAGVPVGFSESAYSELDEIAHKEAGASAREYRRRKQHIFAPAPEFYPETENIGYYNMRR